MEPPQVIILRINIVIQLKVLLEGIPSQFYTKHELEFVHMQNLDLNPIKDAYVVSFTYIVSLVENFTLKLEKLKD